VIAGRLAGVFAEDLAAILGGGKAGDGGDVFRFTVGGPKQFGGSFDAAALQPVVRTHAGLTFEDEEQMCAAASGFFAASFMGSGSVKWFSMCSFAGATVSAVLR